MKTIKITFRRKHDLFKTFWDDKKQNKHLEFFFINKVFYCTSLIASGNMNDI